jgi:hypothetical protein
MGRRLVLPGVVVATLLLAFQAPLAHSAGPPLNTGSTQRWVDFTWGQDGWSNVITVRQPGPAKLYVTDLFCRGDVFDVYDNGVLIGTTSMVAVDEECDDVPYRDNPREAFRDPTYSSGVFELVAAERGHQLRFRTIQNFIGFGSSVFSVRNVDGG